MNLTAATTIHCLTVGSESSGERLDRVLASGVPQHSRSRLKALILDGHVALVAGEPGAPRTIKDPSLKVKAGQQFEIALPAPTPAIPEGQAIPLAIAYEDADIIVVDKPAGMVVHPAPGNADRTLVNALIAHCGDSLSGIGGVRRPGIVHRIDKDTSGLLVIAKNDVAHRRLAETFQRHDIERTYLCLVWGVPVPTQGEIRGDIGRHPVQRKRMAIRRSGGKPAITHYRVLRRFGETCALVECRLETGRTHQIRVHMASIGHPIIGDKTYGRARRTTLSKTDFRARVASQFPRQALHAAKLGFRHPSTGEPLSWEAPLPSDMESLLNDINIL
jgi:23S rRNA pseudouridine1911/1915/1917 synthase